MGIEMMVAIVAVGILAMVLYSHRQLKGKMLCTFRRANKTMVEKLVPAGKTEVIFDGGKYNVNSRRITLFLYKRGIHQFFPTYIPRLDFSFDSPDPLDPENFQNSWDTPESRLASGQAESFQAFAKGIDTQIGKKSRFPEWLFPAITIGAVLVIGYLVYQQGEHLSYLEQLIKIGQQGG